MENKTKIFIILFVVIVLFVIHMANHHSNNIENMINIEPVKNPSWNRNPCNYYMNTTLKDVLKTCNVDKDVNNWSLYMPCHYDDIDKELDKMPDSVDGRYFIINNADYLTAKEYLWQYVVNHHGLVKAKTMLPNTYVFNDSEDIARFKKEFVEGKPYIMKKNIQRQEGLKISKNYGELLRGKSDGYVLIQELLQNPYTISDRKTNMRFYVLVVCRKGDINVYVHNNGFMYYTKQKFNPSSFSDDNNITTGYIDRQIYIDNPLTHQDLITYLDKDRKLSNIEQKIRDQGILISDIYFYRIRQLLRDIYMSFIGKICGGTKLNENVTFQLFGVDVAVDNELNPSVMEINKGPDMMAKDERDKEVKHAVIKDMLSIVGLVNMEKNNGFKTILEFENGTII